MSFIKSEQIGAVLRLTLDRPEKKNAITQEMYQTLADKINEAASDFGIRAVVICASGVLQPLRVGLLELVPQC